MGQVAESPTPFRTELPLSEKKTLESGVNSYSGTIYIYIYNISVCLFLSFLSFKECVRRACRTQYDDGMALHCSFCLTAQQCTAVVSLWRSFFVATRDSLRLSRIKESARTMVVLDIDGHKKRINAKNTNMYSAALKGLTT